jgi:hypothetical protein
MKAKKTEMPTKLKRTGNRRSVNAQLVAQDVIKTLENGGKVNLGKIIKKRGYADSIAKNPDKVTKQPSYTDTIEPFVQKMLYERDKAIERMGKIRDKAKYRDLTDAIDKLTKNAQLLSGKETDRVVEQIQVYVPQRE